MQTRRTFFLQILGTICAPMLPKSMAAAAARLLEADAPRRVMNLGRIDAMRAIDDYPIEVLISLALVTGTYTLAAKLHMSGPIAMVVAGLLIGYRGPRDALSDETQRYLFGFWTLVDEILNSVLFLLIGLEVLVLRLDPTFGWLAASAVPLVLLARLLAVSIPVLALSPIHAFVRGTIPVLTWGGLRGGISIALALSLPEVAEKSVILAATYAVVLFTIVVQGLSLRLLVERVVK